MIAVFSPEQLSQDPVFQLLPTGLAPHPESVERAPAILDALAAEGIAVTPPEEAERRWITAMHDPGYLDYLERVWWEWQGSQQGGLSLFPSTFPRDREIVMPEKLVDRAGWHCFDTYTPITQFAYRSAMASASTAITAADRLLQGDRSVYALCRPPGHHAGRDYCGGFCYLNNAAIAANYLVSASGGRVAVLDLDYHHGNGTQDLLYERGDIYFASIHGDPRHSYPYFSGYADETGTGAGAWANLNLPLPPGAEAPAYLGALEQALDGISRFGPMWLVISLGADICVGDPEGGFELLPQFMHTLGHRLRETGLPLLIVQEGGYAVDVLGPAVLQFLRGAAE